MSLLETATAIPFILQYYSLKNTIVKLLGNQATCLWLRTYPNQQSLRIKYIIMPGARKEQLRKERRNRNTGSEPKQDAETEQEKRLTPLSDQDVRDKENEFLSSRSVPPKLGSKLQVRPHYGTAGDTIKLLANYFELHTSKPALTTYLYTIAIAPNKYDRVPKGKHREQILRLMLKHPDLSTVMEKAHATDLRASLVTSEPLPPETGLKLEVVYKSEGVAQPPAHATRYNIDFTLIHTFEMADLKDYVEPLKPASLDKLSTALQALNVILGYYAKETKDTDDKSETVGSKRIFAHKQEDKTDLGSGLVAWREYFFNVVGATSRILVNVNITHGAFYQGILLSDLIRKFRKEKSNTNLDLQRFLRRLRLETTHLPHNHIAYRKIRTICGLATREDGSKLKHRPKMKNALGDGPALVEFFEQSSAPTVKPEHSQSSQGVQINDNDRDLTEMDGEYITVQKFFKKTYYQVQRPPQWDQSLPVVNVGTSSNPVYLPAEVCNVLPGQVSPFALLPAQTTDMIKFAKINPSPSRQLIVEKARATLGFSPPSRTLSDFGLTMPGELLTVPGRLLKAPQVLYQQSVPGSKSNKPRNAVLRQGGWNIPGCQFCRPAAKSSSLYCVRIAVGDKDNLPSEITLDAHLQNFVKEIKKYGTNVQLDKTVTDFIVRSLDADIPELADLFGSIISKHSSLSPPPLVLIVLPRQVSKLYHNIKTLGDVKHGLRTVCVIGSDSHDNGVKFYAKDPLPYFANVALKINLKLQGANHVLGGLHPLDVVSRGSTMVVGIDVTHPSPGSGGTAPSVFAIVASIDNILAQWPVEFGVQKWSKEEVISDTEELPRIFLNRIKLWQEKNPGKLLQNIIIYRDGVSESQYDQVIQKELETCKEACKTRFKTENLPRFTFIVCTKRHHTRFYQKKDDQVINPLCGTVVDRGITHAPRFDFFLQSHHTSLGTARGAYYTVLHDEVFADRDNRADAIQSITYNMCYLFGRATKAVSICPPVYLADLACTRARSYLPNQFQQRPRMERRRDSERKEDFERRKTKDNEDWNAMQAREVTSLQKELEIHGNLRDTMFYI